MSNFSAVSVSASGCLTSITSTSREKYLPISRPLISSLPAPGRRKTRAVEVLRRPVP